MKAERRPRAVTAAELAARLRKEQRVLAVSHEAPDGDALGCLSSFLVLCGRLGVRCDAYIPGESGIPPEYSFLPRVAEILRGHVPVSAPETTVYFFDCGSLLRSNSHGFSKAAVQVNVDHHQDNPGYGDLNLLDPKAPSTSALIHEVLKAGNLPLDEEIALGLYVGLVTDTGRFQYSNTTPGAHRMAADLQEAGVDVGEVYRRVYESRPLPKMLLLERALGHMEVRLGGALVVSWLGNADFLHAGADEGHAEGLIDTLRCIEGVQVAALVRERVRDGAVETKVSLRSTDGSVDVGAMAASQGGGGHARAAGFTSAEDLPSVLSWIEGRVKAAL
jgi:phosphoesterase RecJ-like protein